MRRRVRLTPRIKNNRRVSGEQCVRDNGSTMHSRYHNANQGYNIGNVEMFHQVSEKAQALDYQVCDFSRDGEMGTPHKDARSWPVEVDKQWRATHLQNLASFVRSSWPVQQKRNGAAFVATDRVPKNVPM